MGVLTLPSASHEKNKMPSEKQSHNSIEVNLKPEFFASISPARGIVVGTDKKH
jgi:hypothetical protein